MVYYVHTTAYNGKAELNVWNLFLSACKLQMFGCENECVWQIYWFLINNTIANMYWPFSEGGRFEWLIDAWSQNDDGGELVAIWMQ